jgi:3-hydroxymyristoyl/3-hydroxydecanoyl-(acyl carrier protein) dehydratase
MIEAMAQNAIQIAQSKPGFEDKLFIFQGAEKVKFLHQVNPGAKLTLSATIFWTEENRRGFANCMVIVDHRTVAEAVIQFVVMRNRTKR